MFSNKRVFTSIFIAILVLAFNLNLSAAYLTDVPQTIIQPDGTVIACLATGDEFYNWLHDKDGYTIIRNDEDGYYYYAILQNEKLIPSVYKVGITDPQNTELKQYINIPAEKRKQIRNDFLKNYMPEKPVIDGYRKSGPANEFNTLNNIVVYIRFNDQPDYIKDTTYYWNMFNNTSPGYNSMQNYFYDVTYEELEMPSWFYPIPETSRVISYQDDQPRSYFLPYSSSNTNGYKNNERGDREHALLKRAIAYVEDQIPLSLNTDDNNDGYVDNVVFIIKGAASAWSTLLWPHRWVLYGENVMIHDKRVWDYNFQIEIELDGSGNGVLCHETYHSLGAPDLYHYSDSPVTPVGRWDVMEQNLNPPQSMGAFMKYKYGGWIEQIPEITECGIYSLNPITNPENNCFKIASPNSSSEFFVVEYRVKEGPFESSVPGTGLLVYRIDSKQNGNANGPPDEIYVFRPGGTTTKNGELTNAYFSANVGRTEISDDAEIKSFLQNGSPGGLNITNVGIPGETISFEVTFEKTPTASFDVSSNLLSSDCEVDFTDFSGCDVDEWEWKFDGGIPATSIEQNPTGIAYETDGKFDVTLIVKNSYGSDTVTYSEFIEVNNTSLPEVAFEADKTLVCAGEVISLTDYSKVCPISWNWEISPGSFEYVNETNAESQNPQIICTEAGEYTVKLTAANSNGSAEETKSSYLMAGGLELPLAEDFEDFSRNSGWTIVNPDGEITWEITGASGNGGNFAAGMNNIEYYRFLARDQLISPPINLIGPEQAILTYQYAYALMNESFVETDTLVVKISTDCGLNWIRIKTLYEDGTGSFSTVEPMALAFIPTKESDWCLNPESSKCDTIDLSPFTGNDNVQIMFESVRILGNNLYVDNISIDFLTAVEESADEIDNGFSVFPNPSNGKFKIDLKLGQRPAQVEIYNIRGQLIKSLNARQSGLLDLDLSGHPKGLYLIKVRSGEKSMNEKIFIR